MTEAAVAHALRLGHEHLAARRYEQAAEFLANAVAQAPSSAELQAVLGSALMGLGKLAEAERSFADAVRLRPDYVEALNDLGNAMRLQGKMKEAIASYREAARCRPDLGMIHQNLGTALAEERRLPEAEASLREAVRLQPARPEALHDLGVVLQKRGDIEQAMQTFNQALRLNPELVLAHVGLARCRAAMGSLVEAIAGCEHALRLDPRSHDALVALGVALQAQGRLEEAAIRYREALRIKPESPDATYQLATVAMVRNDLDEAAAGFRETLRLQPAYALAENNLGNVLLAQARPEEAIACFERAQQLQPDFVGAYSNVLFALNFISDATPEDIYMAHRRWGEAHAAPLAGPRPAKGSAKPDRRLRVGYVSGDFRAHSVSLFIEPVLEFHDRRTFEVFCYADAVAPDEVTSRLKALADHWVVLTGRSDQSAAERIRQDGIDILVDLAGHTGANRLLTFARGPAPVQVTWLGYPNTTGMTAMDYRISDALADPPGMTERYYAETLARMPDSLWCYRPDGNAPPVGPLPALENGHVTFGSLNNFAKVTPWTRALWAKLLAAVPESRLTIVGVPAGETRVRIAGEFASQGVDPRRVTMLPRVTRKEFFQCHHLVDIALDPYPFQGGTTTCETLWMGVPVVTLAGRKFSARAGVSLLTNAGLAELIASTPDEYIAIAATLAGDAPRLAGLRRGLRQRMVNSPLTDERRFTANLEALYRGMWQQWCRGVSRRPDRISHTFSGKSEV